MTKQKVNYIVVDHCGNASLGETLDEAWENGRDENDFEYNECSFYRVEELKVEQKIIEVVKVEEKVKQK